MLDSFRETVMKTTLLAGACALFAGLVMAQDIGMKEEGGIRWACGGAGVEERAALAALRSQANLELLFVTAKRGGYLADVALTVYAAGKPVLQVNAEGPICELFTPAAKYRIEAVYGGVKRSEEVTAGAKIARVVFRFPEEPWDGIRASDEEKRGARMQ
jgi:hypothetical protein